MVDGTPVTKPEFPEDPIVSNIVKDPKQPLDTMLLTGLLGRSSEDGYTRVYFDYELRNYVEVPDDAILYSEPLPKETSPLGGVYLWLKRDAEVIQGKVGQNRNKSKFLEGPIVGAAGAGTPLAWPPPSQGVSQPPMYVSAACPATTNPCQCQPQPSLLPACPPTAQPHCQQTTPPACPYSRSQHPAVTPAASGTWS